MPDGTPTEPTDRITKQRVAEYMHAVCVYLRDHGGTAKKSEVIAGIQPKLQLSSVVRSKTKNGHERWCVAVLFQFIGFAKAGFLKRRKGVWYLLDEGRAALEAMSPLELLETSDEKYAEWDAAREDDDGEEYKTGDQKNSNTLASPVWLIGTGRDGSKWDEFRSKGEVRIGFTFDGEQVGDLAHMSRDQLNERICVLTGQPKPWNTQLACWQFAQEISAGDLVIARTGFGRVLGVGRITGQYQFDPAASDYAHSRAVDWFWTIERRMPTRARLPFKTLTEMSSYPDIVDVMLGRRSQVAVDYLTSIGLDGTTITEFFSAPAALTSAAPVAAHTDADYASAPSRAKPFHEEFESVFPSPDELNAMVDELRRKKALILQGPPGTGKTYIASALAKHFAGDESRVTRVQFHPAYGYEDFVCGIRATTTHFGVVDGPLLQVARKALNEPSRRHVLLIDEFNRGNVARILGEALSLLEADKRNQRHAVRLALEGDPLPGGDSTQFWLPENLFIIGTMNTADRSIALVDHALRRRFSFIDLEPAYDNAEFVPWLTERLGGESGEIESNAPARAVAEKITETMQRLNKEIAKSVQLGTGHRLGHSYFCSDEVPSRDLELWARSIFEREIKYQLREYCADNPKLGEKLLPIACAFDA